MNAPRLGTVLAPSELLAQYRFLDPVRVDNPLAQYPNRDWERMYRDIFRHDRTFSFLCAPNDTHNCLLKGFVKNNVLVRIEPTCGYKGSLQGVWLQGPGRRTRMTPPNGRCPVTSSPPTSRSCAKAIREADRFPRQWR